MTEPCLTCGETNPKRDWEDYRPKCCPKDVPFFAGHWTRCPDCGHLALYINMCGWDEKTGKSFRSGAPDWVYKLTDDELAHLKKLYVRNAGRSLVDVLEAVRNLIADPDHYSPVCPLSDKGYEVANYSHRAVKWRLVDAIYRESHVKERPWCLDSRYPILDYMHSIHLGCHDAKTRLPHSVAHSLIDQTLAHFSTDADEPFFVNA